MKKLILVLLLALCLAQPAWAGMKEANAAYHRGDYATAYREFKPLAAKGDAVAQYNLGVMYYKGQGVPKDYKQAACWYRKAAEQGHTSAQYSLGAMYSKGEGVPKDNVLAHMWLNLAAFRGNKNAIRYRDAVAAVMTPQQKAEAKRLAREWKPKK
ncbi:MAG: tetratricopeptide repeat protein [Thermodesulfobacteriota bacterium]